MNKYISIYKNTIEKLSFGFFVVFILSLAFPWRFSHVSFIIWVVFWFLEGRWLNFKNFYKAKSLIPIVFMCMFVLWEVLSLFWSSDRVDGIAELKRHFPIFIILFICAFGLNKYHKVNIIKLAFLIGVLLSILSYSIVIYQHVKTNTLQSFYPFWCNVSFWDCFGNGSIGIIKHRNYYCIVLLMSLFFSFDLYQNCKHVFGTNETKVVFFIVDILISMTIVLTGSRMGIFMLPITFFIIVFLNYKGIFRKFGIVGIITFCILLLFLGFKYNIRLIYVKEDIQHLAKGETDSFQKIKELRFQIYACIFKHKDYFGVKGIGFGASNNVLKYIFKEEGLEYLNIAVSGVHNTYLKIWMELGFFAFLFMLFIFISSPIFHTGNARKTAIFTCILFAWSCLTENTFSRMGALYPLYAIILIIYLEQVLSSTTSISQIRSTHE